MASLREISESLKLIDTKKEGLKKAFDDLQAHSSLISSFSLNWSDLDSHFTSIQSSLSQQFRVLESLEFQRPVEQSEGKDPVSSSGKTQNQVEVDGVPDCSSPRPELRQLCQNMDGKGLKNYIFGLPKDRGTVRNELPTAIRCAPDPAMLILDAMEGFYCTNPKSKGDRDMELCSIRRTCILLLETLMDTCPNLGNHVKDKAKTIALEWKRNVSTDGENPLEALGLLHLVATFGLKSEFKLDDLVDYFSIIARYRQATKLCKAINLGDKVADLVQKLISKGKQLLAVKFIFEFELTDKYPPVPLLKEYVKESKKLAKAVCREGKNSLRSLNEATAKEVGALRSVIKIIEDYKIDSEYPRLNLEKRIEQLEKQKTDRKRPAAAAPARPRNFLKLEQQQQQRPKKQIQQKNGSKRLRMNAPAGSGAVPRIVAGGNSYVSHYQQPLSQSAGLLPDHHGYDSPSVAPYGVVGSSPTVASYPGSSAGLYGLAGGPLGLSANANTAGSQLYGSDPYMPSVYYDGSAGYSGYGVAPPQYHPSYYPQ